MGLELMVVYSLSLYLSLSLSLSVLDCVTLGSIPAGVFPLISLEPSLTSTLPEPYLQPVGGYSFISLPSGEDSCVFVLVSSLTFLANTFPI